MSAFGRKLFNNMHYGSLSGKVLDDSFSPPRMPKITVTIERLQWEAPAVSDHEEVRRQRMEKEAERYAARVEKIVEDILRDRLGLRV
jgi:hypothetical protein